MEQIISYHIKRADAGTQRLLTKAISPHQPAARIIRSLKKVYPSHDIQFINHIDKQVLVHMDEADLMEIFGNVLENACKYGAKNIWLHTVSDSADNKVEIVVKDDGPGFPEGMQDRLLSRGVRADSRVEGQGIGLSISCELVENYGGSLTLSNNTEKGASVVITLPTGR